jgi:hypothetical protein
MADKEVRMSMISSLFSFAHSVACPPFGDGLEEGCHAHCGLLRHRFVPSVRVKLMLSLMNILLIMS